MKTQNPFLGKWTSLSLLIGVFLACRIPAVAQGTVLYNLNFTPQDVGTYQVVAGDPTVQSSVGPFANALIFAAASTGQQILLPISAAAPGYDLQCDVLTQNLVDSDYAFRVFIDTSTVSSLNFHGGLDTVYLFESSPYLNLSLAPLTDDSVYHLDVLLDSQDSTWSVAINGASVFSGSLAGLPVTDIRFGMAPWLAGAADAPGAYAALDNVIVSTVPEPAPVGLAAAGILFWLAVRRRNLQNSK